MASRSKRLKTKWNKITDEEKKLENSLSFTTKNRASFWEDNKPSPVKTLTKSEIQKLYPEGRI